MKKNKQANFTYSCSFENGIETFKISEYSIYLIKAFGVDKFYINPQSLLELNIVALKKLDKGESLKVDYDLEEDAFYSQKIEGKDLEFSVCGLSFKLSNSISSFIYEDEIDISKIIDRIIALVFLSENIIVQKNMLLGSIKYFEDKHLDFVGYKALAWKLQSTYSEIFDKKEEVLIDYSESKLTEKIIALNEVGVLDYLLTKEPFNLSVNSLAEYLSLCLGEKTSSIQSYINPIINKSDQTKSPYNTPKTVDKVKQKLIQIGLKIE
jgi:hypothetical protein